MSAGRFAPSPTGAQHLGNARTYLLAYWSARKADAKLVLRIEDVDSPRVKPWASQQAIDDLWMWRHELNIPSEAETTLAGAGVIPDPETIKSETEQKVKEILTRATLDTPQDDWAQKGGKTGYHTEYLGYILAEMQFLQRAYPGLEW